MKKEFMKILVAVLLTMMLLPLVTSFPRTPSITTHGSGDIIDYQYTFNMEEYRKNYDGVINGVKNKGTLGGTRYESKSVEDELLHYYPKSLKVIIPAFFLSLLLGVIKGIFDYRNTYSRKNVIGNGTTWLFQSIPDFFLVIFVFFVAITYLPQWKLFSASSWYNVLVVIMLISIYPIMYIARLVGVSLLAQDGSDYIKVAKSKGLSLRQVINRHMMRKSLEDLNRYLPTIMVIILSNLLMVEYLSGYQGAAYRLFIALGGVQTTISPYTPPDFEAGVVLGIALCFLFTILLVQFLKLFFTWKFSR